MTRQQTLDRAAECVMKDRQATHGKPEDSFALIAKFWSAYLGIEIKPHQVAELMILLKVARARLNEVNEDNRTDAAGYAACAAELAPSPPLPIERMTEASYRLRELLDNQKNNPCTGVSPAPLPATVLQKHDL